MPIQALILLAILAASAVVFTVVFVIVADRELAKPETGEGNEAREGSDARAGREGDGDGRMGREEKDDESGGGRGA